MSKYRHKSHNVTILLYHLVFPTKYRRVVVDEKVDKTIKDVCLEIEKRYEINFLENSKYGNENIIMNYVKKQGQEYKDLYKSNQLTLL